MKTSVLVGLLVVVVIYTIWEIVRFVDDVEYVTS